jgi:AcrR family transcriptional regulator
MLPKENEKLDPRVKRTRQMIELAFEELITEKGFQNLSVQDITERAGLNRATFYAHFPDKYALLDHAIRQGFHQEIEKRMLNVCQFSTSNLRTLVIVVCEFVDNTHGRCARSEQQFQSLIQAQVRVQIHDLINHWLDTLPGAQNYTLSQHAQFTDPQARERAATAASWALYGLANEWSHSKRTPPVEQYADQVLPLVAANLGMTIEMA